jgi:hypothetical protein
MAQSIEHIDSPARWFAAKTGYDLLNAVSLGTLSQVESQFNFGTWAGVGESTFHAAGAVANTALLGVPQSVAARWLREGIGLRSTVLGLGDAALEFLPAREASVLSDPASGAAQRWEAGGYALAKVANMFAFGLAITGKTITVPGQKGLGTHPLSLTLEQVRERWQSQALRGQLRKTPSPRASVRRQWIREKGPLDKAFQVDHVVEQQLNGAPRDIRNFAPLDSGLNRTAGNDLQSQISGDSMGRRYDRVLLPRQRVPLPDALGVPVVQGLIQRSR